MIRNLFVLICTLLLPFGAHTQAWSELGGVNGLAASARINTLCADAAGNIYAAGLFRNSLNNVYVAKWNGSSWSALGDGFPLNVVGDGINAVTVDGNGNVYAAGDFAGTGYPYVAKWDGTSWSELNYAAGVGKWYALCTDATDNIYAAGGLPAFVAQKNGSTLEELGPAGTFSNVVSALATDATGNLYAAGRFLMNIGWGYRYVAKWDGVSWTELGTGSNALSANGDIYTLATDAAGNVYAAGNFTNSNNKRYVAKWNGTSWSEVGTGNNALNANNTIYSILPDNAGNIYAAGNFATISNPLPHVVKWNGTSWSAVGSGNPFNSAIASLTKDPAGNIYAAGWFTNADDNMYVAKYGYAGVNSVDVGTQGNVPPVISINEGTLQLVASVLPATAGQSVVWSVSYGAAISTAGLVTAQQNGDVWAKATSVQDPSKADSIKITISNQGVSGIDAMATGIGFRIYPSPVISSLYVSVEKATAAKVYLYDITGILHYSGNMKGNNLEIDMRSLAAGVYIIEYNNGSAVVKNKFTKQ